MKLLIVMITYNRLKYTQLTLQNLLETIKSPYYFVLVDNNSTDDTGLWLADNPYELKTIIRNPENYYPGKACNIGWSEGIKLYPEATHLMRLDNDMHLEPSWDKKAAKYFENIPDLGQLGLDHEAIEGPEAKGHELTINGMTINPWPGNVGGPNIISRAVWDYGLRYDETPWQNYGNTTPTRDDRRLWVQSRRLHRWRSARKS